MHKKLWIHVRIWIAHSSKFTITSKNWAKNYFLMNIHKFFVHATSKWLHFKIVLSIFSPCLAEHSRFDWKTFITLQKFLKNLQQYLAIFIAATLHKSKNSDKHSWCHSIDITSFDIIFVSLMRAKLRAKYRDCFHTIP